MTNARKALTGIQIPAFLKFEDGRRVDLGLLSIEGKDADQIAVDLAKRGYIIADAADYYRLSIDAQPSYPVTRGDVSFEHTLGPCSTSCCTSSEETRHGPPAMAEKIENPPPEPPDMEEMYEEIKDLIKREAPKRYDYVSLADMVTGIVERHSVRISGDLVTIPHTSLRNICLDNKERMMCHLCRAEWECGPTEAHEDWCAAAPRPAVSVPPVSKSHRTGGDEIGA